MASRTLLRPLHLAPRTPFLQPRISHRALHRSPHHLTAAAAATTAAVQPPDYLSTNERKVFDLLTERLAPLKLEVQDISGGCGSMYGIEVVSDKFRGLSVIKQHRLVNEALGEEIKTWHGVQLKTKAP